jgi:hypothetical protein
MFKPSKKEKQLDMFASIPGMLSGRTARVYNDDQHWHNVFREHVLSQIDESIFKPLYSDGMGAPNAPIRILIGMMTLKEAFGWSDSQLFHSCRYDVMVRSALGIFNFNDDVPTESTYYLLRKHIQEYNVAHQVDLIVQVFQQITSYQSLEFEVHGSRIRMDSKLIGSNIAWSSRYALIHDILGKFYIAIDKTQPPKLTADIMTTLAELSKKQGDKEVHYSTTEDIKERLPKLGPLCYEVLCAYQEHENEHYLTLKRVFEENFRLEDNDKTELIPLKELKTDCLQSPFDPDCAYHRKGGQIVKGFSVNITETCDDESLNLITDVQVVKANQGDTRFVQSAVEQTSKVLGRDTENLHADGAYHSLANVEYCQEKGIKPFFTAMHGPASRYDLELVEEQLIVTDTHTGEQIPATQCKSGRWKAIIEKRKRYISQKEIDACRVRKEIAMIPKELLNIRNNVEATIFQLSFHTRNGKTRYRGIIQNKNWAVLRCMWINVRRIMLYLEENHKNTPPSGQKGPKKPAFFPKSDQKSVFGLIFCQYRSILENLLISFQKRTFYEIHFS